MGAQNSVTQTVPIENPYPQENVSIQISPEVALRLSNAQRAQLYDQSETIYNDMKCSCKSQKLQELTEHDALLHKSAVEMQEEQFSKTIADLERLFGKPMEWTPEEKSEADKLRKEVLQCYKQHTKEPLRCKQSADDFQNFVFKQQMENILKEQQKREEIRAKGKETYEQTETEPRHKRAGPCGGRNTADDSHVDTGIHVGGSCQSPTDPPDLHNVQNEWKQQEQKENNEKTSEEKGN